MWSVAFHEDRHEIIFIQLSLWNDIFTWEQGMDETKLYIAIYVDISLIHKIADK